MAEVKTQKIILKRSSVAGKIPTADQLDPGELAINLADGLLTSKDTENNIIDLNSFDRKMGFSNDSSKGEITSTDSIKTALSKIENNIIDNEKVVSESLNDLNTSKVNKSSVTVSNPTLSWGTESTIGTVDNKSFKVTMPSNPNTDTKVTSSANHYTPVSETYTPATGSAVAWGGSVITGITKDSKGHITGVTTGTIPSSPTVTDTKYTFANGTNGFTVTPSGGSAQTVTVTPSIANNVTGSGTSGYIAKFSGANTVTNGPALGSSTTTFLRNDGTWASVTVTKLSSPDGSKVLEVTNNWTTLSGYLTVSDRVNSVNGFFQTSDKRLKENVIDLKFSLDKISKIPTVNFNYISDEDKRAQIGTIADEVEEVFPELVSKGSDGYKTVDYSKFSIIALSAIKELSKKVDELSKKVNGL